MPWVLLRLLALNSRTGSQELTTMGRNSEKYLSDPDKPTRPIKRGAVMDGLSILIGRVVPPALEAVSHRQYLPFKLGAHLTGQQVELNGHSIRHRQAFAFPCDQQSANFLAGTAQQHSDLLIRFGHAVPDFVPTLVTGEP